MIREDQRNWIRERFGLFDEARCAGLFDEEQPEEKGGFPVVRFRNGVRWYPVRERRPLREGQTIKADAPKGSRTLLYDTLDPDELVLVEGEGDLLACVSVGLDGVATAGGIAAFQSKKAPAKKTRALFQGKAVRVLFDPDEHGEKAAPLVARALLEDGALRVACVFPPGNSDIEDWLGGFETSTLALGALYELLGSVVWADSTEDLDEPKRTPVQAERIRRPGDDVPDLVVMVYDDVERKASLAVFAPRKGEEPSPRQRAGYPAPRTETKVRAWQVLDEWADGDKLYVPDFSGDTQRALDNRMLIIPPPPYLEPDSSESLWDDLTDFYRAWLAVAPEYYDVLAAYCLLTYRLNDAGFEYIGFLRFVGPFSSGKGRALDVMRHTCWRTYTTKPSVSNLHRVVDWYGDFSLVIDEFHPGRGHTVAGTEELVDLLNYAFYRSASLVKMDPKPGGGYEPHMFSVFGPKLLASYTADEEASFARRCVVVPMTLKPETAMVTPQFPKLAVDTARGLRGRLLAWRGRKLALGCPDGEGPVFQKVVEAGGIETAQVFWPLCEMVPEKRPEALENVLTIARRRKRATRETVHTTVEAYVLDVFVTLWASGRFYKLEDGWFLPTQEIADEVDREKLAPAKVGKLLKLLGLNHVQRRYARPDGYRTEQRKGFLVRDPASRALAEIFEHHGVEWPGEAPEPVTKDETLAL